jgi:transcriptional regulator with XRE-family HTH domain
MTLGERVKSLRKERGWTLREFADRTGLSVSYHSDIETDRTDPALKTLVKIADAFDMKVIEVLWGVDLGEYREPIPFDEVM